ncbi:uncharacterized protein LOC125497386 [Beta vulgaris subsp. vulgaris]|uniref:uncharacterized protein LOC125497386 n=1 Tax=Beta vulgaris subsp. vulgaris TaxID=3555 RepID=UPI002036AD4F|nr:uncharacterized protein LOC125497386 [Beta vulgaris subsp. vulgaris]
MDPNWREFDPPSPPPISPSLSPLSLSPESPPRIHRVRAEAPLIFTRPALPLLPDTSPLFVDYIITKTEEEIAEISLSEVKKLILDPKNVERKYKELLMYVSGAGFSPAHLPQIHDVEYLPEVTQISLKWILRRGDEAEVVDRELLHNFGPWLDPQALLPHHRTQVQVRLHPLTFTARNNTNAILLANILPMLKQMKVWASWEEVKGGSGLREAEVILKPQRDIWIYPETEEAVLPWRMEESAELRRLKRQPHLPCNMSVIMWNVRGISRPSFKPNAKLLIHNHSPDLLILVETQVSRQNTGCMIQGLGFDSSHLVEPTGRVGGILLLWKAERIKLHILGENSQGVYALVEGIQTGIQGHPVHIREA